MLSGCPISWGNQQVLPPIQVQAQPPSQESESDGLAQSLCQWQNWANASGMPTSLAVSPAAVSHGIGSISSFHHHHHHHHDPPPGSLPLAGWVTGITAGHDGHCDYRGGRDLALNEPEAALASVSRSPLRVQADSRGVESKRCDSHIWKLVLYNNNIVKHELLLKPTANTYKTWIM